VQNLIDHDASRQNGNDVFAIDDLHTIDIGEAEELLAHSGHHTTGAGEGVVVVPEAARDSVMFPAVTLSVLSVCVPTSRRVRCSQCGITCRESNAPAE